MQRQPVDTQFDADKPWRTLGRLYLPERRSLAITLVSYLLKASPVWILPVVTANLIDIIAHKREGGAYALWLNAAVGAIAIIQNIPAAAVYVTFLSRSVRNVEVRLRSALVRRLQMLSIAYHSQASTGALQTKVTRDVESIEMMSRQIIDIGFFALMTILVALTITACRMPFVLPAYILFVPFIFIVRRFMGGIMRRHNQKLREQVEGMNSLILGMINMIPITRAHAAEDEEIARLETQFDNVRSVARSFDFSAGTFGATAWVMLMLFNLGGLTTMVWLSYKGTLNLTPGDIALVAVFFNTIMGAVMQLNAMLPVITRGFDALRSIGEVLECPDLEENRGKNSVTTVRGEFQFENVSFSYRRSDDLRPALQNINFHVGAGESIGIVGPSGSGKSTLAGLVTGFHRPTSGRILLDGVDMNQMDLRTYRRHLAVVSQQTILFNGTLRENIVYGTRNVGEAAMTAAIDAANASEFIRELPRGLETEIGTEGVQFSGGQRQRIAIARALLRNPRVLILDEATSSLDSQNEKAVQEALQHLMVGRTTFIIAHRLRFLGLVNRIIVLENGFLIETGNPADLASRADSYYSRIQRMQPVSIAGESVA